MSAALLVSFLLVVHLGFAEFELSQDQLLAVQVYVFLTWCCNCKLLVVQQCPGRLVGAVVAERKWPPRTSQWLLCRLSKKYGSFLLLVGWNWTKRGLKLYGARWVLEETLWFIISVIQDVLQLCVEAKLKAVSGCPYGGKNLVITIQTRMTTNTNQNMPNKRVIITLQVIFSSLPFVHLPAKKNRSNLCWHCLGPSTKQYWANISNFTCHNDKQQLWIVFYLVGPKDFWNKWLMWKYWPCWSCSLTTTQSPSSAALLAQQSIIAPPPAKRLTISTPRSASTSLLWRPCQTSPT